MGDNQMSMTQTILDFEDVGLRRRGRHILKEIDWRVVAGERWAILGPNGAGKTSLLRLASTYETPSTGEQTVLTQRVGKVDVRDLRTRIGVASLSFDRLVPGHTRVRDLVVMGQDAQMRRWHQDYSTEQLMQADGLLDQVGCRHLAQSRFAEISAGEQQRVRIARALMGKPEILLLDEPTAGLDVAGREQLVAVLDKLALGEIPAIVFVTHHPEEIPPSFSHGLLLNDGRIVAKGLLDSVMTTERLTECFGIPVEVERRGGRYRAWLHPGGTPANT